MDKALVLGRRPEPVTVVAPPRDTAARQMLESVHRAHEKIRATAPVSIRTLVTAPFKAASSLREPPPVQPSRDDARGALFCDLSLFEESAAPACRRWEEESGCGILGQVPPEALPG